MAIFYVRSTDGSDSDNGSTWALAKATLAGAAAAMAAGDTLYVSQAHAETQATAMTITFPGTPANPNKIICANDAAEPPTAVAATATVTTTGASNFQINGSFYCYGITFSAGSGANSAYLALAETSVAAHQRYKSCTFIQGSTASSAQPIRIGTSSFAWSRGIVWTDCNAKFSGVGNTISIGCSSFKWRGGAFNSGTVTPTVTGIFNCNATSFEGGEILVSGVDLSVFGTTVNIFTAGKSSITGKIRNCKLPASWAGNLIQDTLTCKFGHFSMENCDSSDTNYRFVFEDYAGKTLPETVIKRTDGASDGTTGYSWKMTSTANASYPTTPNDSPELPAKWNTTTGSAITVTVDIVHDSVTALTDAEVWLEVQYLGTSGFPVSSFISDAKADILATAADQTTSSSTWTTTGLTNPNKQKLEVTFTPQEAGFIQAKVYLAKASYTIYVDPKLQVS